MITTTSQIVRLNPHWSEQGVPKSRNSWHREIFSHIEEWLFNRQIIVLQGLRRVGKSTLMEQLRDKFVGQKLSGRPKNYFYFSFENEDLDQLLPISELDALLDYYFREVLSSPPARYDEDLLIVLDEIQNVSGWQSVIKQFYDINPKIKFIVSGSAGVFLRESSESLAGRIIEFEIPPLSFREFQDLSGIKLVDAQKDPLRSLDISPQFISKNQIDLFETFLLCGGFPECALGIKAGESERKQQEYIRESVVNKVILKDIRNLLGSKSPLKDLQLFKVLAFESGNILNKKKLASDVGYAEETVKSHIDAFKQAFLLNELEKFSTKLRHRINSPAKSYVSSPSIGASMAEMNELNDRKFAGYLAETYAFQRLSALKRDLTFAQNPQNKEIDFFMAKDRLAIECKYSTSIELREFKFLLATSREFALKPVVFTKSSFDAKDGAERCGKQKRSAPSALKFIPLMFI